MSLLQKFEHYPLTFGPTPIEHLPRLSAAPSYALAGDEAKARSAGCDGYVLTCARSP